MSCCRSSDAGQLTDARGRRVDFRNSIIVMTSNLGSDLIKRDTTLGFAIKADDAQTSSQSYERMKDKVMDEVKRFFRPEFLNRLDATIVFHALERDEILAIVDLMMGFVRKELEDKQVDLDSPRPPRCTSERTALTRCWERGRCAG